MIETQKAAQPTRPADAAPLRSRRGFCGEIRLNHWYRCAMQWHTEPVIRHIYNLISRVEARHGGAYLQYMKRALNTFGATARAAFAKVGVLMASSGRSCKPLHPTNLHVNKGLFPNDTVQSKLPDPAWLEHWLDEQIRFDRPWEDRVVSAILRKMSNLLGVPLETNRDLQRYRKELASRMAA